MCRIPALALFGCLSACAAWPDLPDTALQGRGSAWPVLLPLSEIVGPPPDTAGGDSDARLLASRAEALRQRASLLRTPVDGADAFEALRARIAG